MKGRYEHDNYLHIAQQSRHDLYYISRLFNNVLRITSSHFIYGGCNVPALTVVELTF
jgi:hypothetical protein